MSKSVKLIFKLLSGNSDKGFSFTDLIRLLETFGFNNRIKGSHHIFYREGIAEIINLKEGEGGKAKPYQVKQVRDILTKYKLIKEI